MKWKLQSIRQAEAWICRWINRRARVFCPDSLYAVQEREKKRAKLQQEHATAYIGATAGSTGFGAAVTKVRALASARHTAGSRLQRRSAVAVLLNRNFHCVSHVEPPTLPW